jgi:hypothetical protein
VAARNEATRAVGAALGVRSLYPALK